MSINHMIHTDFPESSVEDWKIKSEETLKGKSIDTLNRSTYENIQLKPLYTKEDQNFHSLTEFPGLEDQRRGNSPLGYVSNEWYIAQRINAGSVDELKEKLVNSLEKGQTAISFEVNDHLLNEITGILGKHFESYPIGLNAGNHQSLILKELENSPSKERAKGYIAKDPIAMLAKNGSDEGDLQAIYDEWAKEINHANQQFPLLRTILVDTAPYHNGGANAIQEVAIAISAAVYHIEELNKRGMSLETIFSNLVFHFSIGANFFMEIAKLRAARILWSKIGEAYGITNCEMIIAAETSKFTKTVYDPYVNLLRAGSEAFAAVLGGIHYLHVSPFNEPEEKASSFSDRIARNTQLILKEEAHLTKTVDPAGGSWYVESLTNELVQKGWELFLEIEDRDGMIEILKTDYLQEKIKEVREKREKAIYTRKQSIIGTNIYANLSDEPLHAEDSISTPNSGTRLMIKPIPQSRLSVPYEGLRRRLSRLKETGKATEVGLICLGELKNHKIRKDFIAGFLSPAGIETIASGEIQSMNDAASFISSTKYSHFVLCGTDEQYQEIGYGIVKGLSKKFPTIKLFLAGLPGENEKQDWLNAGINQFLHARSNCFETLSSLLTEMEGNNE